jgi:hypothetical protein
MHDLAKAFILIAGLLPIEYRELEFERVVVDWMDGDTYWSEMIAWAGSEEDFAELKAWMHVVGWICETEPWCRDIIIPYASAMIESCPMLHYEFPQYEADRPQP